MLFVGLFEGKWACSSAFLGKYGLNTACSSARFWGNTACSSARFARIVLSF